jgi:hypothetical protein
MASEQKGLRRFPPATFYVALAFLLLISFSAFKGPKPLTLQEQCETRGGEWLHGSEAPVCITSDGQRLTYDEKVKDFLADELPQPMVASASTSDRALAETACSGSYAVHGASDISTARPVAVDFSSWPEASQYRSAITKDVKRGVNFAGHYVVASWGCPQFEACQGYAVIDALDGKILSYGETSYGRPRYLPDSRLLETELENGSKTFLINEESKTLELCK